MNDTTSAPRKRSRAGVFVAVVIAIAVATGVIVQRQMGGSAAPESVPTADAGKPADAPAQAASSELKVPEVLPQFELQDRAGTLRKLGEWKGRPLVVNYWATWCPPCVREIPLLSQLRRERREQNLEVIGIAVDFREDVLRFADERALDYPLLIGEEDGLAAVSAVGMTPAFPFTLFADSQQRIIAMKVGELHYDEAMLILDRVAAIDAGTMDLATARSQITAGLKELATQRGLAEVAAAVANDPNNS